MLQPTCLTIILCWVKKKVPSLLHYRLKAALSPPLQRIIHSHRISLHRIACQEEWLRLADLSRNYGLSCFFRFMCRNSLQLDLAEPDRTAFDPSTVLQRVRTTVWQAPGAAIVLFSRPSNGCRQWDRLNLFQKLFLLAQIKMTRLSNPGTII